MPANIAAPETSCCNTVVLELWAAAKLASSSVVLLLPAAFAGAAEELDVWTQTVPAAEASAFVNDLVEWIHLCNQRSDLDTSEAVDPQKLQLVADCGMGLLRHSLLSKLMGVAGMLLKGLTSSPFNLSLDTIAAEASKPVELMHLQSDPSVSPQHLQSQQGWKQHNAEIGCCGTEDIQQHHAEVEDCRAEGMQQQQQQHAVAEDGGRAAIQQQQEQQQCNAELKGCGTEGLQHHHHHHCNEKADFKAVMMAAAQRSNNTDLHKQCCAWVGASTSRSSTASSSTATYEHKYDVCARSASRSVFSGSREEGAAYWVWLSKQHATLTKAYFIYAQATLGVLHLRSSWAEGSVLSPDNAAPFLSLLFYSLAVFAVHVRPRWSEACILFVMAGRLLTLACMGLNLCPIPRTATDLVLRFRTEAILEVFIVSFMEVVPIRWLVPLRVAFFLCYASFYQKCGLPHPVLQSLAVNAGSLLASWLVDMWHRRIFADRKKTQPTHGCARSLLPSTQLRGVSLSAHNQS